MSDSESIIKGVDKEIEFTILDSADNPINIAGLLGAVVILYYNETKKLVKYSINSKIGFEDIITGYDDVNGKLKVLLQSEITKNAEVGKIYAELKIQTTNASYENNTFNSAVKGLFIGLITDGTTKNITSL